MSNNSMIMIIAASCWFDNEMKQIKTVQHGQHEHRMTMGWLLLNIPWTNSTSSQLHETFDKAHSAHIVNHKIMFNNSINCLF